jgi:hypothetical protein
MIVTLLDKEALAIFQVAVQRKWGFAELPRKCHAAENIAHHTRYRWRSEARFQGRFSAREHVFKMQGRRKFTLIKNVMSTDNDAASARIAGFPRKFYLAAPRRGRRAVSNYHHSGVTHEWHENCVCSGADFTQEARTYCARAGQVAG